MVLVVILQMQHLFCSCQDRVSWNSERTGVEESGLNCTVHQGGTTPVTSQKAKITVKLYSVYWESTEKSHT